MIDEDEFQGLLQQLERELGSIDAPVLRYMRPGLSDSEIDEIMARTSLQLPLELRLWWRWHDGADDPDPESEDEREIGPGGWLHLPLHEAIDLHNYHEGFYREQVAIGSMDVATLTWRPGLFPFSHSVGGPNDVLAADTLVPEREPAPVSMRTFMGLEAGAGTGSFSALVGLWIELLESGHYHSEGGMLMPRDKFLTEEPRFLWLL